MRECWKNNSNVWSNGLGQEFFSNYFIIIFFFLNFKKTGNDHADVHCNNLSCIYLNNFHDLII